MPKAIRRNTNAPIRTFSDGRLVSAHQLNVWQKIANHISGSIVINFKNGPSRAELEDWEHRAGKLVAEIRDVLK